MFFIFYLSIERSIHLENSDVNEPCSHSTFPFRLLHFRLLELKFTSVMQSESEGESKSEKLVAQNGFLNP